MPKIDFAKDADVQLMNDVAKALETCVGDYSDRIGEVSTIAIIGALISGASLILTKLGYLAATENDKDPERQIDVMTEAFMEGMKTVNKDKSKTLSLVKKMLGEIDQSEPHNSAV